MEAIAHVDAGALFGAAGAARDEVDAQILAAAHEAGFMVLTGLPASVPLGADARAALFRLFDLPLEQQRPLWRQASAPENPNVYRGFFPLDSGVIKEGMDIGPERSGPPARDALLEPTPLPAESLLPGWCAQMREAFAHLEGVGRLLMGSLARGLRLPEAHFEDAFRDGNSTLRLIRYPAWPAIAERHALALDPAPGGSAGRRYRIGGEHVDSGFVTLLQQDMVGGLQARTAAGQWVDVEPVERSLVVNFGLLLERWTGGRIRATEHRVLGNDVERRSIPFFYEPRVDATIAPLPLAGAEAFEPFAYGEHLWVAMTRFTEFSRARRWPDDQAADAT